MSYDQLPEDEKKFIVSEVRAQTRLSYDVIEEMLQAGWSYIQDGDGHKWTLNALEGQTVAVPPGEIAIPEVLLPPSGIPINAKTVHDIYEYQKLRDGEGMTVEHVVLMAILRSVYKGYETREIAAKESAAKDDKSAEDPSKPIRVRYYGDQITEYENQAAYQQALKDGDEIAHFGEVVTDGK